MRKLLSAAIATALMLPMAGPTTAEAQGWRDRDRRESWSDRRYYSRDGRYRQAKRLHRDDRVWRGNDGRYYCKRDNGTTGLIVGAVAGGLLGNTIAGSGDKTLGTLLGGAGGALLGREIDRGGIKCR